MGVAPKAAVGHERGDRAQDGDGEVARIHEGTQKAHKSPCDRCEAHVFAIGRLKFILERQVSLLEQGTLQVG